MIRYDTLQVYDTITTYYCDTLIIHSQDTTYIHDTITVVAMMPEHNVYIPNGFSPNGDGNNDNYEVCGKKETWKHVVFMVFDRWGEKVFESRDIDFKWDGRFKGELLSPGVYVYSVKIVFTDSHVIDNKGSLTIIR